MNITELEAFVTDLLHIDEALKNKLIDLGAAGGKRTLVLTHRMHPDLSAYLLELIASHMGKGVGNTVLRGSARIGSAEREQILGGYNDVEWQDFDGGKDVEQLHKFIEEVYKEMRLKGNNPLFLSVGALRWQIAVAQDKTKEVVSPILLFPIKLIRSGDKNIPVYIEFVNDDVYVNPCLIAKLRQVWGDAVADAFPLPEGTQIADDPVDLAKLQDGTAYFSALEAYAARLSEGGGNTVFRLERNYAAIAAYRHDEICAYYDIRRNREKVEKSELVRRIFSETDLPAAKTETKDVIPACVLPRDRAQEEMIKLAASGESFIVKGPPGTGKTLTIANMIAALLAEGKRVVFASKKLSALSEVYGKLPERLRPFAMLLDGETESEIARTDPIEIKRELKALIERRKKYVRSDADVYGAREQAANDVRDALVTLIEYNEKLFGKDLLGESYYHALDVYCKGDYPVIALPEDQVNALGVKEYAELLSAVADAGTQYDRLTEKGTHPIEKNPWYTEGELPEDAEGAIADYETAAALARSVSEKSAAVFGRYGVNADVFPVIDLKLLCGLPKETLSALAGDADLTRLRLLLEKEEEPCSVPQRDIPAGTDVFALSAQLNCCHLDGDLTAREAELLCRNSVSLERLASPDARKAFYGAEKSLADMRKHESELLDQAGALFKFPLDAEQEKRILRAYPHLAKYTNAKKAGFFDIAAKKDIAALSEFVLVKNFTLGELAAATVAFHTAHVLKTEGETEFIDVFRRVLHCEFTDEISACADILGRRENLNPVGLITAALDARKALSEAAAPIGAEDVPFKQLCAFYRNACLRREIEEELCLIATSLGFTLPAYTAEQGHNVLSAYAFMHLPTLARLPAEKRCDLAEELKPVGSDVKRLHECLALFAQKHFTNYYACKYPRFTVGEIPFFAASAIDRDCLSAAKRYAGCKQQPLIRTFFKPFEEGMPRADFTALFEHAVFAVLVERGAKALGELRNGLGRHIADALEKWEKAKRAIDASTLARIEGSLMASFDPADPAFAFVEAQRGGADSLRKLFKQQPKALLKLKHCFILSPSSVSVLFGGEDYSHFDTVIIDEASQLEPTSALPVLFRTEQCILVGDEFQMPPIKHFTSATEKRIATEDGEEILYEADISVLSLALRNHSFPVRELKCHYRSKTESLIAFSQERYYPNMRTFPATVPLAEGVGFRDVYVENGSCKAGVNRAEAEEVVRLLEKHFATYFDGEKLSESVGVVAFGEAQIEEIKGLVSKNRALSDKIATALKSFDDLDERLIFFKTIETVQGQETEHLILSLTYGKSADGRIVQSFGQMNRGTLGQCIFNVAVTRARATVTVVHSVAAHEINNENVAYIGDYLRYAERFAREGLGQFVNDEPQLGFLRSVVDYLVSIGIKRERIVCNYGVTRGSVRIPVAVLSADGRQAQLGIWCESYVPPIDYFDENVLYFNSLKERGWTLYRLFAHDWVDNRAAEQAKLRAAVAKYVII